MTLTLGMVTVDSLDAAPLAAWWAEQTAAKVVEDMGGEYVVIAGGSLPLMLAFQKVPDPAPGKNRLHLDMMTTDLDGDVDRLLAAGAGLVERRSAGDFHWVTMTDPAGNEFCVADHGQATAEFSDAAAAGAS